MSFHSFSFHLPSYHIISLLRELLPFNIFLLPCIQILKWKVISVIIPPWLSMGLIIMPSPFLATIWPQHYTLFFISKVGLFFFYLLWSPLPFLRWCLSISRKALFRETSPFRQPSSIWHWKLSGDVAVLSLLESVVHISLPVCVPSFVTSLFSTLPCPFIPATFTLKLLQLEFLQPNCHHFYYRLPYFCCYHYGAS